VGSRRANLHDESCFYPHRLLIVRMHLTHTTCHPRHAATAGCLWPGWDDVHQLAGCDYLMLAVLYFRRRFFDPPTLEALGRDAWILCDVRGSAAGPHARTLDGGAGRTCPGRNTRPRRRTERTQGGMGLRDTERLRYDFRAVSAPAVHLAREYARSRKLTASRRHALLCPA